MEDHFNQSATLLETHEGLDEPGIIEHSTQHSGSKFARSSHDPSASILDKIFGNVMAVNAGDSEAPVTVIVLHTLSALLAFDHENQILFGSLKLELKLCLTILFTKYI